MFEKYLEDIGLTDKEAKIYLALLKVENSSVLDLAKKTGIKRPTVYVTMESLAKKGLVSETTVGKKTFYLAESPERLETFLQRQKVTLEEKERRIKDIISQIKSVQREGGEKPVIQYFEGIEGVLAMNELAYDNNDGGGTSYLVYSRDLLEKTFPAEQRSKFKLKRLAKNVKNKVLYNYSAGVLESTEDGERIKVDEKMFPFSCDVSVYKDRVMIGILGKRVSGIFIRSKDFADTLKNLFLIAFNSQRK